jgi:hypothetical protein
MEVQNEKQLKIVRKVIKIKDKAIKEASIKKRIKERNTIITKDQWENNQ